MKVRYDPKFYKLYKRANIRIQKSVDEKIAIFIKNPHDLQLHNHALTREWKGYRSIDITENWRAIYKEKYTDEETTMYFVNLGTHEELSLYLLSMQTISTQSLKFPTDIMLFCFWIIPVIHIIQYSIL